MNKLKSIIQYECMTSFKYIWIFYAIQYAIVGLITLIIGIVSGSFENVGTNCLEINTLFFVSILGALGFKEDFKTLIQNGFTRKYIFIAALSLFIFKKSFFFQPGLDLIQYFFRISFHRMEMTVAGEDL